MDPVAVLHEARRVGLTVWVEEGSIHVEGHPSPEARTVVEVLRQHKTVVLTHLSRQEEVPANGSPSPGSAQERP